MELDIARQYADGIVLWGGYDLQNDHPRDWDETAPWWQVTKMFMSRVSGVSQLPHHDEAWIAASEGGPSLT